MHEEAENHADLAVDVRWPEMRLPRGLLGWKASVSERPPETAARTDAWKRWTWAWYAAFYAVLIVITAIVVANPDIGGGAKAQVAILSVALGAAHAVAILTGGGWGRRIPLKLAYVAATAALWFLLVGINPAYFILLFVLYGQIYTLLPMRWAIPSSLALTAVVTSRSLVDSPDSVTSVVLQGVFWAVFGTFWAFWVYSIIGQSQKRRDLIEELETTRNQLAAEERRAGTLEERSRLAREIHDTLAQGFISIVTHLEAAEEELPPNADSAQRHLDQARRTARDNLVEARNIVAALRPEILAGSSLPEALQRLTTRWSEASGVRADLNTTGEYRLLSQEAQVALLRATQEALANIRKHARAGNVTVTLSYMEDLVVLDVQDNGAGFDPDGVLDAAWNGSGFGLRAMRQRVESLGGRLLVESDTGAGSTLVVEVPDNVPDTVAAEGSP